MGNLKCTCMNNNESNQVVFESNNNIITPKISLFELITKYYSSKNIKVQKIRQDDFFAILHSDSVILKILDEYEELFVKYNIKINKDSEEVESIKFIDNNQTGNFGEYLYFGEFNKNGIINGIGIKIIKTNYIYKGEFSNDEYNGKGLLIKNNSSIFGDWEEGEINGNVIYKIYSKFEYNGNFENNKKNGFGTEKYQDGSQYVGNFVNNKKNGNGKYSFPNNEYDEGNFENDLYNGEGQYVWEKTGKKYIGEFKNGKIEGKGTYIYEDGSIFRGTFINGYKNGEGFIEFPDGKKYLGSWLNDELYGNGYFINGNKKIEVVFRHGKIISQKINEDFESNLNDQTSNVNQKAKFKINNFCGDKNNININKFICKICDCFLVDPIKCSKCQINFCKECITGKKCIKCNNENFEDNKDLNDEMINVINIKCDICQKILKYSESLNHFH